MKDYILHRFAISLSLLCCLNATGHSQDSFSTDTTLFAEIRKQKFIDRYENVFMTKVPTRNMLKVGVNPFMGRYAALRSDQLLMNFANLMVGYEYKLHNSFSVGINVSGTGGVWRYEGFDWGAVNGVANVSGQFRWYYDMNHRIKKGLSASNFSGNYIGIVYEHTLERGAGYQVVLPKVGLEYGVKI